MFRLFYAVLMNVCNVKHFFDPSTFTLTYLVYDQDTKDTVLIDGVLDYQATSGQYRYDSAKQVQSFVKEHSLKVHYILETHAHADHLTAARYFKELWPQAKIAMGERIKEVQRVFTAELNLSVETDGSQFDELFFDGQDVAAGSLCFKVLFTPGHTPACVSYFFGEQENPFVFTGDALFMPDYGTGRCDFPAGSAEELYDSIQGKLYQLPESTMIYVGHDYMPGGREMAYCSTIELSKRDNIRLQEQTTKEDFVTFREERDAKLSTPKLLYPSIQVNINGGHMPAAESNGKRYLKIPLSEK